MLGAALGGVLVVCLLAVSAYLKLKTMRMEKVSLNIPGMRTRPVLGNAAVFRRVRDFSDGFYKLLSITDKFAEHGLMKLWFANYLGVIIWEPEYIEIVCDSPATANKGEILRLIFGEVSNGVVSSPGGREWKELRRPLTKAMSRKLLEGDYLGVMVRHAEGFLQFLETHREGRFFDVLQDLASLTLSVFSETHLGLEVDEVWNRKWYIGDIMHTLFDLGIPLKLKYHFYFWRLGAMLYHKRVLKIIDGSLKTTNELLQWMFDERKKGGFVRADGVEFYTDFLLRRGRERHLPEAGLRKELMDVVTAGVDTTAVLMSSALVFLAMFPEVQEKAHREQAQLVEDCGPDYTPQLLAGMQYLEMVLKETLRFVSPPGIFKSCEADLQIGDYVLPKGCYVYLMMYRLHRDPRFWEQPQSFYPEHFAPEQVATRPRNSFQPFGCGARICPGFQYGIIQAKIMISLILRRYKLTTNLKYEDIVYDLKLMLNMKSYQIKVERR